MKDSSGHEIRYYKVKYSRNLVTGNRLTCTVITSERQLQQMLYDESRYDFLVLSAEFLQDYIPDFENEYNIEKES